MASDITGFNIYNRQRETFELREGLVMCNLLLADESTALLPKRNRHCWRRWRKEGHGERTDHAGAGSIMVIATQNPAGYVGTYPLPEAQLDRFAIKLSMGYPTAAEEISIIRARKTDNRWLASAVCFSANTLRDIRHDDGCPDERCAVHLYRHHGDGNPPPSFAGAGRIPACVGGTGASVAGVCFFCTVGIT